MEKTLAFPGGSSPNSTIPAGCISPVDEIPRPRFIRKAELCYRLGIGNTALYQMIAKGLFPAAIHPNGGRTAVWLESWADEYIVDQVAAAGRGEVANG